MNQIIESIVDVKTTNSNSTVTILAIEQCLEMHFDLKPKRIEYTHNGSNYACLEHAPTSTKSSLIRAYVLSVLALLSLIGNLATIISIERDKRSRSFARPSWTAIYSLIYQLSVADLLVTVFCIAGEAAWSYTVEWYAGNVICKLFKFFQVFSLYLSTFILVLISVDRWLAVKYPMKSMGTAKRNERMVICAWTLSFILSVPQAIVFHVSRGPFVEDFYQCVTHGFYTEPWQEQMYTTMSFVFMFIIPLIILISTYVSTVKTIANSEKVFKVEIQPNQRHLLPDFNRKKLIHRAKMKSLRISVVIVAAFVTWWTPYYVMMLIYTFVNPDQMQSNDLQNGIFFFGMSNSLVNPIIYGAFHLWPRRRLNRRSERDSSTAAGTRQMSHNKRGDANSTSLVRVTTIRKNSKTSIGKL